MLGLDSMKRRKSLRQIGRELGVSASYLSQILNGKRPASEKVCLTLESEMLSNSNTSLLNTKNQEKGHFHNQLGISLVVGQQTLDL
jgi:transcriptional regulator with XRE-family HTH domain